MDVPDRRLHTHPKEGSPIDVMYNLNFTIMGAAGNKKPKKPGKKHEASYLKDEVTHEMPRKNPKKHQ